MHKRQDFVCGVDEVGRGSLAGKVVAAAVVFSTPYVNPHITDSKQLLPSKRKWLSKVVKQDALSFGIGNASVQEIEEHNILQATFLAMHRALDQLSVVPKQIDVDGNRFRPYKGIPHRCIIKGDKSHLHIAAASILAKVYRDIYMEQLHQYFPIYGWESNKGYPTPKHLRAIQDYGTCIHHRKYFRMSFVPKN